jgi:hypothetical protein
MDELKELAGVVSKQKVKKIEIIGQDNIESKINLLYNLLIEQKIESDEDALTLLYKNKGPKSIQNLKKLKQRLKKKLLNTIYFFDLNNSYNSKTEIAFYECYKNWTTLKLLALKGTLRITSYKLAERTLNIALKYEFTDIATLLARELILYHSVATGNLVKFKKYNSILEEQTNLFNAELIAEKYFASLTIQITNLRGSNKDELIERCDSYIEHLHELKNQYNSYRFYRHSYYVLSLSYEVKGDYQNIINLSEEAISYFESKSFSTPEAIFSVKLQIIIAKIPLKQYKDAILLAEENMNILNRNHYNWFVNQYYYIILCIHAKEYTKAFELTNLVKSQKSFKTLYNHLKQNFLVFDAYLNFLNERNKINADQEIKSFRIYKFLNDVPNFTKDKAGLNIAILIVHTLFLLHLKKYNQIIDRVESLNQYCYRYLRKDDTFRSNCFIKMLLQIPKADFNRIRTERYAEKYVEKLNSVPLSVSTQSAEVEFFPYEDLWEITLEMLD